MNYKPKEYWEKRLENQPNLRGVGCASFNETYNKYLYLLKIQALNKNLNSLFLTIKEKSILDVGCGTGFFVDYYTKEGAKKVAGLDIAELSVSMLKERYPTFSFYVEDIGNPNFRFWESFDIVNVFDVLYPITDNGKFETAIKNISNLMHVGGYVLITDVFGKNDIISARHVHFRSLQKYKAELKKNDIEILDIFPMYFLMNRSFHLPPFVLNKVSRIFYLFDKNLQNIKMPNGKNISLLVAKK